MEYTDFVADFARRTLSNLDHVQEQETRGGAAIYPVTQLWNSLLGLIVLPREKELERIPETPMAQLWSHGWPRPTTVAGTEPATLRDLVRTLRNAIAHLNVSVAAGSDREITSVSVWNQRQSGERTWEGRLTVTDLDLLARCIADLYVRKFPSAAA